MARSYRVLTADVDLTASAGVPQVVSGLSLDFNGTGQTVFFYYTIHYDTGNNIGARFHVALASGFGSGATRVGVQQPNSVTAASYGSVATLSSGTVIVAETAGDTTDKTA